MPRGEDFAGQAEKAVADGALRLRVAPTRNLERKT
jgi:hypothetical protein